MSETFVRVKSTCIHETIPKKCVLDKIIL